MNHQMSAERSMVELKIEDADALFKDRPVHGVLLDASGVIIYANEGWKAFARQTGLMVPNFGIGENYLRFCAFADSQSARIVEGITQLLAGKVDCFSLLYPCHAPDRRRWFLLLGFPHLKGESRVALLHLDITAFFPDAAETWMPTVLKEEIGTEAFNPQIERMLRAVERSLLSALAPSRPHAEPETILSFEAKNGSTLPPLSKRQRQVLELMVKGMSNMDIARELSISPNTVKIHVSGILARLGLPSRAQAIHWALTRGRQAMQN
jgi:DNA-binding CsgD family transcriptional regulator